MKITPGITTTLWCCFKYHVHAYSYEHYWKHDASMESPRIIFLSIEKIRFAVPFADITPPMDIAAVRKISIFTSIAERSLTFKSPIIYMITMLTSLQASWGCVQGFCKPEQHGNNNQYFHGIVVFSALLCTAFALCAVIGKFRLHFEIFAE